MAWRLRLVPKRTEWKRVLRRWGILLGAFSIAGLIVWFSFLRMPGRSHRGPLPPLTDAQRALAAELEGDVVRLAATIGERNTRKPRALDAARRFLEERLAPCGEVGAQELVAGGARCANVEVEVPGGADAGEVVVVGGHYDSAIDCPGANDNATGAAAVVALARRLAQSKPARTLRFVAFVNEEPPWFGTDQMGSYAYARRCRERGEKVVAMVSLETLGCYSDAEGSQKYPVNALRLAYPSRADFVSFVGNVESRALVREAIGAFREAAAFPSEGAALPGFITGVGWSDHWAFWENGFPGIMVTDTAPFRYAEYHTPGDVPSRVDFERLARVVEGLEQVVRRIARTER